MKKIKITSDSGLYQGDYSEADCQKYMDMYGAFEGKKPFPDNEIFIDGLIGKDEFKIVRNNVKDSCKKIRKVFPDMKPKYYHDELPDEE